MLDHVVKVLKDTLSAFNRKSYHKSHMCVLLQIITYFDRCSTILLLVLQNIWRNKKMARWMDCFERWTFFITEFTYCQKGYS